jgi:hypothetical protein
MKINEQPQEGPCEAALTEDQRASLHKLHLSGASPAGCLTCRDGNQEGCWSGARKKIKIILASRKSRPYIAPPFSKETYYAKAQRYKDKKSSGEAVQDHRSWQSHAPARWQTPFAANQKFQAPSQSGYIQAGGCHRCLSCPAKFTLQPLTNPLPLYARNKFTRLPQAPYAHSQSRQGLSVKAVEIVPLCL